MTSLSAGTGRDSSVRTEGRFLRAFEGRANEAYGATSSSHHRRSGACLRVNQNINDLESSSRDRGEGSGDWPAVARTARIARCALRGPRPSANRIRARRAGRAAPRRAGRDGENEVDKSEHERRGRATATTRRRTVATVAAVTVNGGGDIGGRGDDDGDGGGGDPCWSVAYAVRVSACVVRERGWSVARVVVSKMKSDSKPLLTAQAEKANHYT